MRRALISMSLAISATVAACGQTGALHLPADAPSRENYLIAGKKPKPVAKAEPAPAVAVTPAEQPVDALPAPAPAPATP